ncbi:MAG: hypothetical protein FWB95_06145 [Treponema sp.]|nr:hypothetical protein [Treponema sp.]
MKKIAVLAVSIIILLSLTLTLYSQSSAEQKGWEKEIKDLWMFIGYSNFMPYSFSATVPPADSYVLYCYEGDTKDFDSILEGIPIPVEPKTKAYPGKVDNQKYGLKTNVVYSCVVVAKRAGLVDSVSNVKRAYADYTGEYNKMVITDLPADFYPGGNNFAFVSTMMSSTSMIGLAVNRNVISVAYRGDDGVFRFCEATNYTEPNFKWYDAARPLKDTTSRLVTLSTGETIKDGVHYITASNILNGNRQSFTGSLIDIEWNQFLRNPF